MQVLEHWDPLNLPRGSIRALITLALLGVLWTLVLQEHEVPIPLAYVTLIILGHYFGARAGAKTPEGEKPPLYLPRGSIRLIIVLGFGLVGYLLWQDGRLKPSLEDRTSAMLFLMAALCTGYVVRHLVELLSRGKMTGPRRIFENLKAVVALSATALLALYCSSLFRGIEGQNLVLYSIPLIVFYFSSRR